MKRDQIIEYEMKLFLSNKETPFTQNENVIKQK